MSQNLTGHDTSDIGYYSGVMAGRASPRLHQNLSPISYIRSLTDPFYGNIDSIMFLGYVSILGVLWPVLSTGIHPALTPQSHVDCRAAGRNRDACTPKRCAWALDIFPRSCLRIGISAWYIPRKIRLAALRLLNWRQPITRTNFFFARFMGSIPDALMTGSASVEQQTWRNKHDRERGAS